MPCQLLSLYHNQYKYIELAWISYLSLQQSTKPIPRSPTHEAATASPSAFRWPVVDVVDWSMCLFGMVSFIWMCPRARANWWLFVEVFGGWDPVIFWKLILWLFAVSCLQIDIRIILLETGYTWLYTLECALAYLSDFDKCWVMAKSWGINALACSRPCFPTTQRCWPKKILVVMCRYGWLNRKQ